MNELLDKLWIFLNSPIGMAAASALMVAILGKIFTARPAWKKIFDENKGLLIDAIRFAENAPEGYAGKPGASAAKSAIALEYLNKIDKGLAAKKDGDLKMALEAALAERNAVANGE